MLCDSCIVPLSDARHILINGGRVKPCFDLIHRCELDSCPIQQQASGIRRRFTCRQQLFDGLLEQGGGEPRQPLQQHEGQVAAARAVVAASQHVVQPLQGCHGSCRLCREECPLWQLQGLLPAVLQQALPAQENSTQNSMPQLMFPETLLHSLVCNDSCSRATKALLLK